MKAILISVRHKWAEKLYSREKNAELRKTTPRNLDFWSKSQRIAFIYEPELGLVTGDMGIMAVHEVRNEEELLDYGTALELPEIEAYGPGRDGKYHVWLIGWAERYDEALPLGAFGLTRPPQSWRYIDVVQV